MKTLVNSSKFSTANDRASSASQEPSFPGSSVNGSKSTAPSADHECQACDFPGCEREAGERQMSEDGLIHRVCVEHKKPALLVSTITRSVCCEYAGCQRTPRYGTRDGPQNFCQGHKRAGMYTCRGGELFMATRDGRSLREASGTTATTADTAVVPELAARSVHTFGEAFPTTPTTADTAPAQEADTLLSAHVPPRKLCQEPGCDVQSAYGKAGSGDPQYCTDHREKGMVILKNRPCLFPGCDIRPHYGPSMGKAVYCVTHKENGMVHLLKEAKALEKEAHAMRRLKSRLNVAQKNACVEQKNDTEMGVASVENPAVAQKGVSTSEDEHNDKVPAKGDGSAGITAFAGEAMQAKERPSTETSARLPTPSSPSLTPSFSPRLASSQGRQKASLTRMAETPMLAPSDEIRLLQEARESARALAEASGSGRRARAPSRKVLEASGKIVGQSAQWMTKEKKEEQARLNIRLKEQRKAAAAAGLKLGHVLEAAVGVGVGDAEGASSGSGPGSSGELSRSNGSWRKLTPAEMLQAAGKPTGVGEAPRRLPGDDATVPNADTAADKQNESPIALVGAAETSSASAKRRNSATVDVEIDHTRESKRRHSTGKATGVDGKDKSRASSGDETRKTAFEAETCSKTAKFGVNGIAR